MANAFVPLAVKASMRIWAPLQWKGGQLFELWKGVLDFELECTNGFVEESTSSFMKLLSNSPEVNRGFSKSGRATHDWSIFVFGE